MNTEHHLMMPSYPTYSSNVILVSHFTISLRLTGTTKVTYAGWTLPITYASVRELMQNHNVRSIWLHYYHIVITVCMFNYVDHVYWRMHYAYAAFHQSSAPNLTEGSDLKTKSSFSQFSIWSFCTLLKLEIIFGYLMADGFSHFYRCLSLHCTIYSRFKSNTRLWSA